jgi:universal stress protein E
MDPIRRVLVAVKNPDARTHPGVEKALHIARKLGASVELFNAISSPVFLDLEPLSGHSLAEIREESLALRRQRLEKIARSARKHRVETSCHVTWDYPPHEAIVRRADQIHADLIIAECHDGKRSKPWLVHLTDWELLRLSTRPVLILKNERKWRAPTLLAAVDPDHAHDKPARLDKAIVERAVQLGKAMKGGVELMHANFPTSFGLLTSDPALDATAIADAYEARRAQSKASFLEFAAERQIPKSRRHLVDTDPVFGIPHLARELGADLVVMGAVSRSGLKRVFIGNTAERVLDALPCDVLVVKPSRVARRVSERPRGMRVVPPQPLLPIPV